VAWLKDESPEKEYNAIRPVLEKNLPACHRPTSGLKVLDLFTYAGIKVVAAVDTGESLHTLMKLSHIHLFGIGLVALGIGLIFRLAALAGLRRALIVWSFVAIFVDILAWFLIKWDPVYACTVVAAGALLGLAWTWQILISLYQLWFLQVLKKKNSVNSVN